MEKIDVSRAVQCLVSPVQLGWGCDFTEACPLARVTEPGSATLPLERGGELRRPQNEKSGAESPPENAKPGGAARRAGYRVAGPKLAGKRVFTRRRPWPQRRSCRAPPRSGF